MKKTIKVIGLNILFTVSLLACFEVVFGSWFFNWNYFSSVIDYKSCKNENTYYGYCPGQTAIRRMAPEDGGRWIQNHINNSGIRVAKKNQLNTHTDFSKFNVYLTGDSFIQADEVDYKDTVGFWLEKTSGLKTLQHGYSTWAPLHYYNYLSNINFSPGDQVFVFLNITDFTPNNRNSNYNWKKYDHEISDGKIRFILSENDYIQNRINAGYGDMIDRSIIVRIYSFVSKTLESLMQKKQGPDQYKTNDKWKDYEFFNQKLKFVTDNCEKLSDFDKVSPATMDFIVYSFASKCWPKDYTIPFDSAMEDLEKISKYVKQKKAKLHVVLFPMGWALEGEGIISKQHPYYSMGPGAVITTLGVLPKLRKRLPFANILEIETLLNQKNDTEPNKLYYSVDSHWTPEAQKIIGKWLGNYLKENITNFSN